ncbi:unnamed protein product [Parnassius apollo]|uniref:(apollo) hypothetical protein n=1 Tax=Parnassius apollo TaxID=110799 RepID=A0A8S3XT23_PARAO|nr:unnamed protein product [Parnassius apollo]
MRAFQVAQFQKLATALFSGPPSETSSECALSPSRVRTLARRRARLPPHTDLAHALAAVLGADDTALEPTQPFEEAVEPIPETWDVGEEGDECVWGAGCAGGAGGWDARAGRVRLYERLCAYFRPSRVPPRAHVTDLVVL